MGTLENLSTLAEKLRAIRERLEATADRAAALQARLRTDAPTIVKLDRLAKTAQTQPRPEGELCVPAAPTSEKFEGELAQTDAWEISLINEEG
jgi:hypothetical protein